MVQPKYEKALRFYGGYCLVQERSDSTWSVIDRTGAVKYVLPPGLEPLGHFELKSGTKDGILVVQTTKAHNIKLDGIYDFEKQKLFQVSGATLPYRFSEGLARVRKASGPNRFTYVNYEGHFVIPDNFDIASDFHEGLAAVLNGNRWSYIDHSGKSVIQLPENCSYACDFNEGLAAIAVGGEKTAGEGIHINKGANWGFIDKTGKLVIAAKYYVDQHLDLSKFQAQMLLREHHDPAPHFGEGLAAVAEGDEINHKFGFIDHNGAWLIQPQFKYATNFTEGYAAICFGKTGFDPASWNSRHNGYIQRENDFRLFTLEHNVIGMTRRDINGCLGEPTKRRPNEDVYVLYTNWCGYQNTEVVIKYEGDTVSKLDYAWFHY